MSLFTRITSHHYTQNDIYVIGSNLVPVLGVWFLGWSATEAFIVYALETIIIGFITLLMMAVSTVFKKTDLWVNGESRTQVSGLFFMFFFTIHYGLFVAVQTSIFAESAKINPPGSGLLYFFLHWYEFVLKDMAIAIMLGVFVISYLARIFVPFIMQQKFRTLPMMILMFQPYGRIFIQQVTVILGSMFLTFGWNKLFILVFALIKIGFEILINFDRLLDKEANKLNSGV